MSFTTVAPLRYLGGPPGEEPSTASTTVGADLLGGPPGEEPNTAYCHSERSEAKPNFRAKRESARRSRSGIFPKRSA